jgi:maleylacetate reductase
MQGFTFDQPASRVIFGAGSFDCVQEEVKRLGSKRALVLSTPEQRKDAEEAARRLGPMAAGIFAEAVMHVPIETAREARATALRLDADCCVAIGGGSTIGLGKAIALESGLPILAIPTTFAGSEMTPIYGLTEAGIKKTGRDRKVLPRTVIYDPILTLTLPTRIAAPSGMNAIAHCVEGLYARDGNPIISLFAAEGIRALARSLPRVVQEPGDLEARS